MKIVGCRYTPYANLLHIECACPSVSIENKNSPFVRWEHPANLWIVRCPRCGNKENIESLRNNIAPGDVKW